MNTGNGTVWITTISRRRFHVLEPQPDEIDIGDIAHSLALQCRFGGHVPQPYSVAQHSILVSERAEATAPPGLERDAARWGLLHDAAEAYIVDVPRPVKRQLRGYTEMEDEIAAAVVVRFDIAAGPGGIVYAIVKRADEELLATEGRDLFGGGVHDTWNLNAGPIDGLRVVPWPWQEAKARFLDRFAELFPADMAHDVAVPSALPGLGREG